MPPFPKHTLLAFITVVSSLILFFIFLTVSRRIVNSRRHRILDQWRSRYRAMLEQDLTTGRIGEGDGIETYRSQPGSAPWQALEHVLFEKMNDAAHGEVIRKMFLSLGYTAYYEERLQRRNTITAAAAADKLGRMRSAGSIPKLAAVLTRDEEEVVSVALRALGRINTDEALAAVLEHLPRLVERSLVSRKTIQAALEQFTGASTDLLVQAAQNTSHSPRLIAHLLGALCTLPQSTAAVLLAVDHLGHRNAEVRAKALKLLSIACASPRPAPCTSGAVLPLLRDPVWFVRFHALRAIARIGDPLTVPAIGELLFDENWQVRNAAAAALTSFGPEALGVFLKALRHDDRYTRESICEEIERTRFTDQLVAYRDGADPVLASPSREILEIMQSLRSSARGEAPAHPGGNPASSGQSRSVPAKEALP